MSKKRMPALAAKPREKNNAAETEVVAQSAAGHEPGPDGPLPPPSPAGFCIAGLGAAAGGLEAICRFFEAMPADSGIAFVVIPHQPPAQGGGLAAEVIGRQAAIDVVLAEDGMALRPNRIHVAPADTCPTLAAGRLRLRAATDGPLQPIDHFFTSLGNDQHERAIGIVFSGSGTDGAQGIKNIEANGGIVLAQTPETAECDSMPRRAIGTGMVNCIRAPADMPALLVEYARHDYVARPLSELAEEADRHGVDEILNRLHSRRGYSFKGYKRNTLIRRIRRRMGLNSAKTFAGYADLLDTAAGEIDALLKDLLIGVTEFFRDPEAWQMLHSTVVVPLVAGKRPGETIRVWVPGCSSGEEAYSVAMLLLEQLHQTNKHCELQVFATDSNDDALQLGRLGSYPSGVAAHVPAEHLQRYFVPGRDKDHYVVAKPLRDAVIFGVQNLMSDPPFFRIDLVCCRNLLIYLEPEIQKKVISLFHFALLPNGYLFLGSAETLGKQADAFVPISRKWCIFRHLASFPPIPAQAATDDGGLPPAAETGMPAQRPSQLARLAQQTLLHQFSPAAVLVNARFEALYFSGPTENYLQIPCGTPTHDFLALVRDGLRSRLRNALLQAFAGGLAVTVDDARIKRRHSFVPVRFRIVPTPGVGDGERLYLVVFEDRPAAAVDAPPVDSLLVRQLEDELRATRDELQNAVERLESANEELKAAHEATIATNEELQSINEELGSSKEELQSLNEELTTVNLQLRDKVAQLEASNNDIRNLLASSEIATICLDRELRIKWFTPSMQAIGNLIAGDLGRPITDFSTAGLGGYIVEDAAGVLDTRNAKQRELVSPDRRCYLRRIVPYQTAHDHIGGVVITYADITEAKQPSQEAAAALRKMAASLEERVRERTFQLRTLTSELVLTEERERRILARDLHDGLGQLLAIVKIKLTSLECSERRGRLKTALGEIDTLIDQANQSIRSLLLSLSPPILETLGLVPALDWLGEEMGRLYGLAVRIDAEQELPALHEPAKTTIFRAVRELLINVAKHAKTEIAEINCYLTEDRRLMISIADQGLGFDYQQTLAGRTAGVSGFGLISVRERIEFIGGEMAVDSKPGYGTTITIVFPAKHRDRSGGDEGNEYSDHSGGRSQDPPGSAQGRP